MSYRKRQRRSKKKSKPEVASSPQSNVGATGGKRAIGSTPAPPVSQVSTPVRDEILKWKVSKKERPILQAKRQEKALLSTGGQRRSTSLTGSASLSSKDRPIGQNRPTASTLIGTQSVKEKKRSRNPENLSVGTALRKDEAPAKERKKWDDICKKRPDSREARKGGGGSKHFAPWCKKS